MSGQVLSNDARFADRVIVITGAGGKYRTQDTNVANCSISIIHQQPIIPPQVILEGKDVFTLLPEVPRSLQH